MTHVIGREKGTEREERKGQRENESIRQTERGKEGGKGKRYREKRRSFNQKYEEKQIHTKEVGPAEDVCTASLLIFSTVRIKVNVSESARVTEP